MGVSTASGSGVSHATIPIKVCVTLFVPSCPRTVTSRSQHVPTRTPSPSRLSVTAALCDISTLHSQETTTNIHFLTPMDPHQAPISATPPSSRKRTRENETESQRNKREKAAERQRRKRERDRQAGLNNLLAMQQVQPPPPPPPEEQPVSAPEQPSFQTQQQQTPPHDKGEELSPDEAARREKVRAAARERQRKHRALVKQKKLREWGLDMGNELLPGIDDVQYRLNADGQYQPIPMHEMPQHPGAGAVPGHPGAHAGQHPHMHEPPFPQGQPLGGQTFASTLLLSFSCAPLLKAHLLRTLNMSNEELASLEPIIAQAWDHWDQQVRSEVQPQPSAFSPS